MLFCIIKTKYSINIILFKRKIFVMSPEDILKLPYRRNVGVMVVNSDGNVWVGLALDR